MTDTFTRLAAALADRYRIERELGEGGMATVYLAEDLKHNRKVAIKVLKPELAAVVGAERFLAEIQTTANLQHPNILPLYDSGEADSFLYYVMPSVEGETLRDRLDRERQLPVDEAVRIATAVANALDFAHGHGVVHRDIKPGNILFQAGQPVVGDFGIALALGAGGGARLTETGLSVGTPYYMSPEQATGDQQVGARSDIYSLGCVLYEMLVGDPPYLGSTAQAVLGQIISGKPVTATEKRSAVPVNVDAVIRRALERLPADRFETARAFAGALADPGFRHGQEPAGGTGGSAPAYYRRVTSGLAIVAAAASAAALWGWLRPTPAPPATREQIVLGTRLPGVPVVFGAAIAPDGSAIVYTDTVGGTRRLWIKERDELHARPLTPVLQALLTGPSFSPDGQWIAYPNGKPEKISRQGGSPIQLSDSTTSFGTAWLDDGTIVFIGANGNSIWSLPPGGAARHVISVNDLAQGSTIRKVTAVPDRDAVLVTVLLAAPRVLVVDLATDSVHALGVDAGVAWVVGRRLMYVTSSGQLLSVPFDSRHLTAHGTPTPILQGIRTAQGFGDAAFGRDGTLLYTAGPAMGIGGKAGIVSIGRDGGVTPLDTAWKAANPDISGIALSPDGSRLALSVSDSATGQGNVFVIRLANGIATRLTFDGTANVRPSWSTDGTTLLYVSDRGGRFGLWTKRADGSGQESPVRLSETRPVWEGTWSPDGKWLVYRTDNATKGNGDIFAVRTDGDTTPVPLVATAATEVSPVVSPNGRWLAYASNAAGRSEVYVRPFPNASGGIWQVSSDGGSEPLWSHAGKELFYRNQAGDLVAVAVSETPTFTPGAHTTLFATQQYLSAPFSHYYAVTPDDKRFLFLRPMNGPENEGGLVLMRDWTVTAGR